jgi:hypothetical protein
MKHGYKPKQRAPVRRGVCTKHGTRVGWTGVCIDCHHEHLDEAGFDWRLIPNSTAPSYPIPRRRHKQQEVQ